jgi:pimeloyl-ACP methyl ester carboxylesterase
MTDHTVSGGVDSGARLGATATGFFVRTATGRLHYLADGPQEGVPLVLLHGASGNLLDWAMTAMPRIAQTHRVIAFDRPGFGYSEPAPGRGWRLAEQGAMLRAGLHALGITRYRLVGHSWSGALVLDWAMRHPEEVAGLVVLSGATMPWGGALSSHYHMLSGVFGGAVAQILPRLIGPRLLEGVIRPIFAPQAVPEHYLRDAGPELALQPHTFRTNARALTDLHEQLVANSPQYPRISCPVEIVHGTADSIVPAEVHARPLSTLLPNGRLMLLDGIGHMPHHTAVDAVTASLDSLVART